MWLVIAPGQNEDPDEYQPEERQNNQPCQHQQREHRDLEFRPNAELHNRIAAGWGQFNQLRHELTNKRLPLHSRLRLFNGTITPSV
eukprot:1020984-Pyramimonas_sp.AAC.1